MSSSLLLLLPLVLVGLVVLSGLAWLGVVTERAPDGSVESVQGRPEGPVVVCLGDSLTHGRVGADWVGPLRERLEGVTVVNAGVNGQVCWNLRQRLEPIRALRPDAVVVLVGTNDVMAAEDPGRARSYRRGQRLPRLPDLEWSIAQHAALVRELEEITPRLAVCTIPPLGDDPDSPVAVLVDRWNHHVAEHAEHHALVDVHEAVERVQLERGRGQPYVGSMGIAMGRILSAVAQHHLLKRSWGRIGRQAGFGASPDAIHLDDVAAERVGARVEEWWRSAWPAPTSPA